MLLEAARGDARARERGETFVNKLNECGIELIVEKVELEGGMPDLLSLAVKHGQGELFGAPRPAAYYLRPPLELAKAS